MYIQPLPQALKLILILLSSLSVNSTYALSTDKQQDMEIGANSAEMDDINGVTIYRGNVTVTQGSMLIKGHTLKIHFNDNGDMDQAIMFGTPATYRQLPDNSKTYDEAESKRMEYYPLKDFVILIDDAQVTKPDGSTMTGGRIEYDTIKNHVIAKGTPSSNKENASNKKTDGRVKITIKNAP